MKMKIILKVRFARLHEYDLNNQGIRFRIPLGNSNSQMTDKFHDSNEQDKFNKLLQFFSNQIKPFRDR